MFTFKIDNEYFRESLLDYVGSKQGQSGILWGPKESQCVIITSGGKHGKKAGYQDKKNPDGTWCYIGQGSKGDQNPYNYANGLLTNGNRNVLLFSTREPTTLEAKARGNNKKNYKFEGIFDVISWDLKTATEGDRVGDKLVVFHLIPSNNIFNNFEIEASKQLEKRVTLADLEERIGNKRSSPNKTRLTVQEYRERSSLIKTYALLRANGVCEFCNKPGPFITEFGIPFLEVHHIFRLADDGPDSPENVAALCPNCHREAHFGKNKTLLRDALHSKIVRALMH
ncbi:HNH endonuclease signature motif containing protein [Pedobacter sp. FW305-3-2-15-E-R2A2]|uniref:HNH endonuclease n=1 Tax=Pedobacter sp. FW305-3-2-15-E-R2A2 TaxID=3140251 RepID=UPI0031409665